jgi:hypothetical protein
MLSRNRFVEIPFNAVADFNDITDVNTAADFNGVFDVTMLLTFHKM